MKTKVNDTDKNVVHLVANSNDQFATKLLSKVKGAKGKNTVMSPYSISAVMAMVVPGCKKETLAQINAGMGFKDQDSLLKGYSHIFPLLTSNKDFTLETANTAFIMENYSMVEEYETTIQKYFNLSLRPLDFCDPDNAARVINDWAKEATKDKIKDLCHPSSFNANTRLVLVNAIYFKGDWDRKFNPKNTKKEKFHVKSENKLMRSNSLISGITSKVEPSIQVDTMKQEGAFYTARMGGFSMIELPYKGNRIVMQILLPDKGIMVEELEKKVSMATLEDSFQNKSQCHRTQLEMPKFKLEYDLPLNDVMKDLGMTDMFNDEADLTGMDASGSLLISEVKQKAFIEVNEEGAEASAATYAIGIPRGGGGPPPHIEEFKVNRPFIFLIRDKSTKMLLFQGRIKDPSQ